MLDEPPVVDDDPVVCEEPCVSDEDDPCVDDVVLLPDFDELLVLVLEVVEDVLFAISFLLVCVEIHDVIVLDCEFKQNPTIRA